MIIRQFKSTDTKKLVDIWYNASIIAHSFVSSKIWASHKDELRNKYLPAAKTYVAEENGELVGFISLIDSYIGGLFIAPTKQGRGIGTRLIEQVKIENKQLRVGVFNKNEGARRFYERNGFKYLSEEVQMETREIVITMIFEKQHLNIKAKKVNYIACNRGSSL